MKSRLILLAGLLVTMGMTEAMASEFADPHGSTYYGNTEFSSRNRHISRRRGGRREAGVNYCAQIRSTVQSLTGSKAGCYMKLFMKESSCNWKKPQARGNAGNPYAAYGLCSIERSPAVRAANNRGPACRDISSLEGQIKCCQSMMRKYGRRNSYFGPVRRGEVGKCE